MNIESERLRLLKFDENLLDDKIMGWFDDVGLMKYYTNSRKRITKSTLVESIDNGEAQRNNYTYFVAHKESGRLIGTVKLGPINWTHRIADLVVLIGERIDGARGIGTEAIRLGVRLAFEEYDLYKLFGGMYRSNVASIKAYTRAGWIVEGILRGHYSNNDSREDRILVGCFNPNYFSKEYIEGAKLNEWYEN